MILVDWQLLDRIARGYIKIDPYDPKLVQPNSLDIRLGNHFVWYEQSSEVIDPYNPDSVSSHVGEVHADTFILNPGQFVLAETLECIELPDNIVATIEGKSSIARLGVTLHQTGGWIDAGFRGTITLEMANVNSRPVKFMPACRLVSWFFTRPSGQKTRITKKGMPSISISGRQRCRGITRIKRDDPYLCLQRFKSTIP